MKKLMRRSVAFMLVVCTLLSVMAPAAVAITDNGDGTYGVKKEEFNLPDSLEPINILAIGYSDEEPANPERHSSMRKPLGELVSYEKL